MGKAILAMIVTVIVGYISGAIFANWVNAPEWGVILAVAVMGAFIITSMIRNSKQIPVCRTHYFSFLYKRDTGASTDAPVSRFHL